MFEIPDFYFRSHTNIQTPYSLTEDDFANLWTQLIKEEKDTALFYDGQVNCFPDYLEFMTAPDVFAYAVYFTDKTPAAVFFVNNFMGKSAMMHFAYFDAGLSCRHAIGIEATRFLLSGDLHALIGLTPRPFRHAWKFATEVGFQVVDPALPQACLLKRPDGALRYVDGVLTVIKRDNLLPSRKPELHLY